MSRNISNETQYIMHEHPDVEPTTLDSLGLILQNQISLNICSKRSDQCDKNAMAPFCGQLWTSHHIMCTWISIFFNFFILYYYYLSFIIIISIQCRTVKDLRALYPVSSFYSRRITHICLTPNFGQDVKPDRELQRWMGLCHCRHRRRAVIRTDASKPLRSARGSHRFGWYPLWKIGGSSEAQCMEQKRTGKALRVMHESAAQRL
jgi:hypothetical protein